MKKTFLVLFVLCAAAHSFGQSKSDLAGVWRATVKAGNKPTTPTYLLFNSDGSYLWGVDSLGNPGDNITKGLWDLTAENEIKLIPADATDRTRYYTYTGANMMYQYRYYDENGQKVKERSTDMSQYLQKLGN
jgi:hypothetical protein